MKIRSMLVFFFIAFISGCATSPVTNQPLISPQKNTLSHARVGETVLSYTKGSFGVTALILEDIEHLRVGSRARRFIEDGSEIFCNRSKSFCLLDSDNDSKFDKIRTSKSNSEWVEIDDHIKYKKDFHPAGGVPPFKYEIVFQGVQQGTIRLLYREFYGDLARPAFSEALTYTFDGSETEINFREVIFNIHEASNSGLKYTVISIGGVK